MNDKFLIEKIRDEVIIQLKPVRGKTCADIGSDTGFMSEGFINSGLKVIALNSSNGVINFLKEKFRDIEEFEAILSDPDRLNLADESVDYVTAYLSLQSTDNPEELFNEIFRILRSGSKAAIIDIMQNDINKSAATGTGMWKSFSFPDIYSWFINAGFRNVSIEKADQSTVYRNPSSVEIPTDIFISFGEK